jgi:gliding motility-associated-like protein
MTMKCKILITVVMLLFTASIVNAQLFYNNGAVVYATTGAIVQVNGNVDNASAGTITNQGDVTIIGNITNDATAGGNGDYHVAGNWINNSTFNGGSGSVEMNGLAQQIAGTQSTHFYDLLLTGTGVKTLGIDAYADDLLALNDRELATNANTMYVTSTNTAAITRTTGFVSSLTGGTLSRQTALASTYVFPVGSSVGTLRYRPVNITPTATAANTYTVRMVNNDATTDGYNRTNIDTTICEANANFYHMIDRSVGSSAADVAINFDVSDGAWEGIANWITPSTQWQTLGAVTVAANYVTKSAWNTYTYDPYILTRRKADASITASGPYCENNPVITLTAAENGGTWTGIGITSGAMGTFDPSISGPGDFTITYTIAGLCGDVDNETIHVNDVATVTAVSVDESCIDNKDGSIDLTISGGLPPYSYIWNPSATTEDLADLAPGSYTVIVSDANSCAVTQTYDILAGTGECIPESFYVPNVFSPNGDNYNDIFYVRATSIKSLKLIIYDRWGEKLFETTDVNTGWDGTFRGKMLDDGVFVWYVEAEMNSGTIYKEKGNITLLK